MKLVLLSLLLYYLFYVSLFTFPQFCSKICDCLRHHFLAVKKTAERWSLLQRKTLIWGIAVLETQSINVTVGNIAVGRLGSGNTAKTCVQICRWRERLDLKPQSSPQGHAFFSKVTAPNASQIVIFPDEQELKDRSLSGPLFFKLSQ